MYIYIYIHINIIIIIIIIIIIVIIMIAIIIVIHIIICLSCLNKTLHRFTMNIGKRGSFCVLFKQNVAQIHDEYCRKSLLFVSIARLRLRL